MNIHVILYVNIKVIPCFLCKCLFRRTFEILPAGDSGANALLPVFGHNVDEISKTVHIQGFGGRGGSKGASESISLTIKIRIPLNCGLILDCVISKGFGEE